MFPIIEFEMKICHSRLVFMAPITVTPQIVTESLLPVGVRFFVADFSWAVFENENAAVASRKIRLLSK